MARALAKYPYAPAARQGTSHANLGGEGRHEAGEGENPSVSFTGTRTDLAGFAEVEAEYAPWSGVVGVRIDHYSDVGLHPIFYLGLAVRPVARLKLRTSGGTGF